ncbi:uncharacterized protein TNCV_2574881 [Trichonephila clavipes]|nr:uncharacterized protein TNCV_2574881 [Trichonephila clavipes]
MENIRKHVDIRLCNNGEKAEKLISKPNFKDRTIFCENLAAFHMGKTSLTLNKPIAVGMSILDISKTLITKISKLCSGPGLDKQMHTILQRKDITDEEKATLYLQILQKFVNFPYPSKNPDIMETVDTKQENYQNQSTDTVE